MHVLVELLLEEVDYLARVEPQVTCIRRQHALRIAALGNVFEIAFFKGDEDLLFEL
jgi:hypothetical protein